jgi:hypothetical protein
MTNAEFSNEFDILYNNIMSNQAPGLNEYEKSVFLTKAQDEIVKAYFSPNKAMEGFDGSEKRQIDFSMITKYKRYTSTATDAKDKVFSQTKDTINTFDPRASYVNLPSDVLMIINETLDVKRGETNSVTLTVVPLSYTEYNRLMSKPFKRPLKHQAWRLLINLTDNETSANKAELIAGNGDSITGYTIRYVKRPKAIILTDLEDVTLDGISTSQNCELDPILHHEILQRAVELAKAAYTGDLQSQVSLGQASQTDIGKSLRQ